MIHQEIKVDTSSRELHANDLLLQMEKLVEVRATDGFILDWDGQSDIFQIRTASQKPLGGTLSLITTSDKK